MALGGHKLPIVDQRRWGTLGSANIPKGLTYLHAHVYSLPLIEMLGSGLNLLYRMDIDSKFNFIDQQANDNIVHSFKF